MCVAVLPLRCFCWGILSVTVVLGCSQPATAPPAPKPATLERAAAEPPTLVVVGRSKATAKPDTGRVTFGVVSRTPSLSAAIGRNRVQAETLIKAVKDAGVAERDIQTSHFGVSYYSGTHEVRNAVEVTVREVDRVGEVVDAAIRSGSNEVFGVTFELDERDALEEQLRTEAMKDARERAEALARLSGKRLGQVVGVSEVVGSGLYAGNQLGRGVGRLGGVGQSLGAAPVPFEAGELSFERSLEVVYAMTD